MSDLTQNLSKQAFLSGDNRSRKITVDKNEIRQLCASFFKIAEGEYTELHNQVNLAHELLRATGESFDEIQEACDYEGLAQDIIVKNIISTYGPCATIFERVKNLELLTNYDTTPFKVNNNLIIDVCLAYEEAESKDFTNLKYTLKRYQDDIQNHYDTFLKIKAEVEYSEVQVIVDSIIKYIESKR